MKPNRFLFTLVSPSLHDEKSSPTGWCGYGPAPASVHAGGSPHVRFAACPAHVFDAKRAFRMGLPLGCCGDYTAAPYREQSIFTVITAHKCVLSHNKEAGD